MIIRSLVPQGDFIKSATDRANTICLVDCQFSNSQGDTDVFIYKKISLALAGAALILQSPIALTAEPLIKVDDNSFKCITSMTKVGHFYVDNLVGNVAGTVKVAKEGKGEYPTGSVLQLMPNEVMIKQQKGYSPATKDWEFFWIDVDKKGKRSIRAALLKSIIVSA